MVFSGGRNPSASSRPVWALQADVEASSCGGSGPRGHACRGAVARVIEVTPSGAEASSGPPDTCRSQGRGVEEASGTPPTGTPGNLGRPYYSSAAPFALRAASGGPRQNLHQNSAYSFRHSLRSCLQSVRATAPSRLSALSHGEPLAPAALADARLESYRA